jgi:uncharacterized RDD family membrane protein YckC
MAFGEIRLDRALIYIAAIAASVSILLYTDSFLAQLASILMLIWMTIAFLVTGSWAAFIPRKRRK